MPKIALFLLKNRKNRLALELLPPTPLSPAARCKDSTSPH